MVVRLKMALNRGYSNSQTSMEQILLQNSGFTMREKYCHLTYKIRTFKNKGATLLIACNTLVMNLLYYLLTQTSLHGVHFIALLFTLPIAGWLADVYLGRYKVIQWSMWIMWVGSMLATLSSVVAQLVDSYTSDINDKVTAAILVLQTIGFAGYQANIYQFCIDQFPDASTNAIKSFISWFIWTYSTGGIAGLHIYECINKQYYIAGPCFIFICLTIALIMLFLLNGIFIKEPVVQNPYKLVYKVIKYALQNKTPQRRSAFTYCEDELPSRMDFGKRKYGGPFTTEQVEDVKTFIRVLAVTTFCSLLPSVAQVVFKHSKKLMQLISHHGNTINECFVAAIAGDLQYYLYGIILIPVHEFIVYPLFHRYFYLVNSLCKFLLGVVLQIVRIVALMLIEFEARNLHIRHYGSNVTMQCIFWEEDGALSSTVNSFWMAIPNIISSTSFILFGIGAYEFLCAQSPYSMRGLIFGCANGSAIVFLLIGYGISEPFTQHLFNWGTGTISCGFWYLLLIGLLMVIYITILLILMKYYKKRKREDVLPNEHIYAERYYDKVIDNDMQPQ